MKHFILMLLSFFWFQNLAAQVVLERDINQEPVSSNPIYFSELNDVLYFGADDGIHGTELYQFDLTSETAELVANLRPYEEDNGITETIAFDGKIFFSARDEAGVNRHLFVYDPVDASVERLMDTNGIGVTEPFGLYEFNGQLFFQANSPMWALNWGNMIR